MSKKSHAVLKAYCMWNWLERTGCAYKEAYPIKELVPSKGFAYCSLCEYVFPGSCKQCPLFNRWDSLFCVTNNGLFSVWKFNINTNDIRKIAAGNIAARLWEVYKELEEV